MMLDTDLERLLAPYETRPRYVVTCLVDYPLCPLARHLTKVARLWAEGAGMLNLQTPDDFAVALRREKDHWVRYNGLPMNAVSIALNEAKDAVLIRYLFSREPIASITLNSAMP